MSLDEEYPKTNRHATRELRAILEQDARLGEAERQEVAMGLNLLSDKASDLDEIFGRLMHERHTPAEIGELLIAYQLTLSDILGTSDLVYGKLFDIGDRLKAQRTTNAANPKRRAVISKKRPVNGKSRGSA